MCIALTKLGDARTPGRPLGRRQYPEAFRLRGKNCSFESAHVLNVDRRTDGRRLDIIRLTFLGRIKIKSANPVYLFHKDVCLFLWVEHHLTREHDKGHYVDRVCLLKDSLGNSTGCLLPFARSRGLVTD